MAARNMYRIEINIHEKELCVKLVIYKDLFPLYLFQLYYPLHVSNKQVQHQEVNP